MSSVATRLALARAWKLRGQRPLARRGFEQVLALDPRNAEAHLELGHLDLHDGRLEHSLVHYRRAAALVPATPGLASRIRHLEELRACASGRPHGSGGAVAAPLPADQPGGRIHLADQHSFASHRSGWDMALAALRPLHHQRGVRFDGFLERNFAWRHRSDGVRPAAVLTQLKRDGVFEQLASSEEQGLTPYREPWVGVLHNPYQMPAWFHAADAPQTILAKRIWRDSLPACRGLFTLSEHLAAWLRERTGLPVSALILPTEIPASLFDFEAFLANPQRRVVQVGWWLRRLNGIRELPLAADNPLGYTKMRLLPRFFDGAAGYLRELMALEERHSGDGAQPSHATNTSDQDHLPDGAYDALLARNLVFLQLYDASANNAVVECIARGTPLLVNPLPAVVEYLGPDYPLYYDSLEQAAAFALDLGRLREAHEHLVACPTRARLDPVAFRLELEASAVYRGLPQCGC
jgi:tetratricopeptide (TPR) repeat protein